MTVLGALLAIAGTFALPLIVYGFFVLMAELEHRRAIRERLRPLDPSDDAVGDFPNLPSGFKLSHNGTTSSERPHDHA